MLFFVADLHAQSPQFSATHPSRTTDLFPDFLHSLVLWLSHLQFTHHFSYPSPPYPRPSPGSQPPIPQHSTRWGWKRKRVIWVRDWWLWQRSVRNLLICATSHWRSGRWRRRRRKWRIPQYRIQGDGTIGRGSGGSSAHPSPRHGGGGSDSGGGGGNSCASGRPVHAPSPRPASTGR